MAKKQAQDDVLGNKFSLMNAKSSKLLSSWMGPEPTTTPTSNTVSDAQDDEADLKQADFGHDRLGVGSPIPKDIADGSFTRRAPTSNDKLLEQLIGKKRAKAHIAAKQEAERASARQQPTWQQKPAPAKEESEDDEEESRAATITSKRHKTNPKSKSVQIENQNALEVKTGQSATDANVPVETPAEQQLSQNDHSDDDIDLKPKKRVKKSRAKPTSYLDELLAERSKKKKGKGRGAEDV